MPRKRTPAKRAEPPQPQQPTDEWIAMCDDPFLREVRQWIEEYGIESMREIIELVKLHIPREAIVARMGDRIMSPTPRIDARRPAKVVNFWERKLARPHRREGAR